MEEEIEPKVVRYYVRDSVTSFEEDATHEFKGHMNICEEEVPPYTVLPQSDKRTRSPISRCINAFLNSGRGGIIYLGIVDSGRVKGLNLTQYRKDHITTSLEDTMSRYNPPVEIHRYRIQFVPLVDPDWTEEKRQQVTEFDSMEKANDPQRQQPHTLRTHDFCWCYKDSLARYGCGKMAPDYIVEISIRPWNSNDPRNENAVGKMRAPPVHEDECGRAYFRRQGSVVQYTNQEMYSLSKQTVHRHYQGEIKRLREELSQLRAMEPLTPDSDGAKT